MNTNSLKTDVTFQSFLVAANVIFLIASIAQKDFLGFIIVLQFIGGVVQLLGGGIHLYFDDRISPYFKYRNLHFIGSLLYLAMLFALGYMGVGHETFWIIILFIIPQIIFYAYYALSIIEMNYLERLDETEEYETEETTEQ
jgi:hypothetical protein